MTIQETIKEGIKDAMRAKDTIRLTTLRGVSTAFVNELVAKRMTPQDILDDASALVVLKRLSKQRKDSIEQFTKGGRMDLVETEMAELNILDSFLPKMMSREEIRPIAVAKIAELGVTDKSTIGKVVGAIMKDLSGTADGNDIKAVLEELLS